MIRLGAVGDVVRTLPAASALRAACPQAHLAWLVEPDSAPLLESQPWLDEVIVFPRERLRASLKRLQGIALAQAIRRFVQDLRATRFDLVVDFHAILRSGVLALLSGAPRRATYAAPFAREGAAWFANEFAKLEPARISRFERNEGLIRYLGVSGKPGFEPLQLPVEALERAAKALGAGPAPVAIHPGTSDETSHKRYTCAGYAAVAVALAEREGVASIVTCGPARDDRAFAQAVVAASGGSARLAPETPTLLDLAALLRHCRLYIGGDTGPLHVASLMGTPVLQLMGPTDPVENAPWADTPSRTVRVQIGCNPCRRGCSVAICMRVISPESVLEAARELLATGGGRC